MDITVTGVDEFTDIARLLANVQPYAEIGILFSLTPEGRARYPSADWISETAPRLHRAALHVCGGNARHYIRTQRPAWVRHFQRIQINGKVSEAELTHMCAVYPDQLIITQHKPENTQLLHTPTVARHQLLVDSSGGRGIVPTDWISPATSKCVGFAGGLGPRTMAQELPRILEIVRPGWWIDMENALRNVHDQFDVGLAREAIDAAHRLTDGR